MKRRSKILTVFTAAAVTFASLFAIAGPKEINRFSGHHHNFYEKCQINHLKSNQVKQPVNQITDSLKTNQ